MTYRIELLTTTGRIAFGRTIYRPDGDLGDALIYFFDLADHKGINTRELTLNVYSI